MGMRVARRFARNSVVALSGFVLAGTGACSSSDDTDGSSTSSSSGSTSSSSSGSGTSSSSSSGGSSCNALGTFAFAKLVYVSNGGKVCDQLAKQSNEQAPALNYEYAKEADGTYSQTDVDDAKAPIESFTLDAAKCVLSSDLEPITGSAKDDDGNPVNIVLKQTQTVTFEGDKATIKNVGTIDSDPAGGKGLPCTLTFSTTGTRK